MGGIWDTVAGTADHLAGSTDEAVGRAVDSASEGDAAGVGDALAGSFDEGVGEMAAGIRNGDLWMGSQDNAGFLDGALGSVDESMSRGPVDDVIDTVFSGHAGDTRDLPGPSLSLNPNDWLNSLGQAAEAGSEVGNTLAGRWRIVLVALVLGIGAYLFRPLLQMGANATEGE